MRWWWKATVLAALASSTTDSNGEVISYELTVLRSGCFTSILWPMGHMDWHPMRRMVKSWCERIDKILMVVGFERRQNMSVKSGFVFLRYPKKHLRSERIAMDGIIHIRARFRLDNVCWVRVAYIHVWERNRLRRAIVFIFYFGMICVCFTPLSNPKAGGRHMTFFL